jgi:hypothetical protein
MRQAREHTSAPAHSALGVLRLPSGHANLGRDLPALAHTCGRGMNMACVKMARVLVAVPAHATGAGPQWAVRVGGAHAPTTARHTCGPELQPQQLLPARHAQQLRQQALRRGLAQPRRRRAAQQQLVLAEQLRACRAASGSDAHVACHHAVAHTTTSNNLVHPWTHPWTHKSNPMTPSVAPARRLCQRTHRHTPAGAHARHSHLGPVPPGRRRRRHALDEVEARVEVCCRGRGKRDDKLARLLQQRVHGHAARRERCGRHHGTQLVAQLRLRLQLPRQQRAHSILCRGARAWRVAWVQGVCAVSLARAGTCRGWQGTASTTTSTATPHSDTHTHTSYCCPPRAGTQYQRRASPTCM